MRRLATFAIASLVLVVACTKSGQATDAATTTASATSAAPPPRVAPPSATVQSGDCEGLDKTPCVLRPGCILDQPRLGTFQCRAAKDECERAVRHADVIGVDVAGVTEADAKAARAKCTATAGCTIAGGKCACPCEVFANCNCGCGGGWLERCVPQSAVSSMSGFPPKI